MRFQKGQSGNPGGKPKELKGIQELARKHAPDAIAALVKVARGGKSESARVGAAVALLDRGFGRPLQELKVDATVQNLTDEQIDARIAQLYSAVGVETGTAGFADGAEAPARPH